GGVLEQLDVLEGAGDAAAGDGVGWNAGNVGALEDEPAAGRLVDAADQVEDGAFSRPVGADDGEDLAFLHVEGYAVDRADAAERDRDVVGFEEGRARRGLADRKGRSGGR